MRYFFVLIFFVLINFCSAQKYTTDTIKVMHYNTLNYGMPYDPFCPGLVSDLKHGYMRTILKYADPDILGLVKMRASKSFIIDSIERNVFDSVCPGCYDHVNYTNYGNFWKTNLVYFKKTKFGYLSSKLLYSRDTNISDIYIHKLYYKDQVANTLGDSVFLNIIQFHLLSGDTTDSIRGLEVMHTLDSLSKVGDSKQNYIIMGDFNSRSASEPCIDSLINPYNNSWAFYDPSNQLGDWSNHPKTYAQWLTISTRAIQLDDCGSKGGMDGIYDHIFANYPLMNNTNGAKYIPNSYIVLGQDGLHVNAGLLDKPTNNSAPKKVISSLYYMSNHLPVMMKIGIRKEVLYAGIASTSATDICKGDTTTLTLTGSRGKIDWQKNIGSWTNIGLNTSTIKVTPPSNISYRAIVSVGNIIDSSNIININMLTAPNVAISPKTPARFCEDDSILLSVLTFSKYLWNTGDTIRRINASTAGTYWVQVTGSNGCKATDTVQVAKISKPNATFSMLTLAPQNNIQFTAIDTNLISYNWDFGDTKTGTGKSVIHVYNISAIYNVKLIVTDASSCTNNSTQAFTINAITNISNINSVNINPNPYNEKTFVQYDIKSSGDVKMELCDISGKIIQTISQKNQSAGSHTQEIQTSASGIYILRIIVGGSQQVYKLVDSGQ